VKWARLFRPCGVGGGQIGCDGLQSLRFYRATVAATHACIGFRVVGSHCQWLRSTYHIYYGFPTRPQTF
jgi:hypothetical protein